jgi:hypothetical protein
MCSRVKSAKKIFTFVLQHSLNVTTRKLLWFNLRVDHGVEKNAGS